MILEKETHKKFGYYPSDLAPKSTKKVICSCDDCGKIRILAKQKSHKLCRSCALVKIHASGIPRKSPSEALKKSKVKRICKYCQNEFPIIPSRVKAGYGIFCSLKCYRKWQQRDKVKRICQICGKEFQSSKTLLEKGWGKFCSPKCHGVWKSHDLEYTKFLRYIGQNIRSPTQPELIFKAISENNNLPFKYTGDGTFFIGKKKKLNPDFIATNDKRLCIEIFGEYWHSPLFNKKVKKTSLLDYRKRFYKRFRWDAIFIWESDLRRKDAEEFVLKLLKKDGVIK